MTLTDLFKQHYSKTFAFVIIEPKLEILRREIQDSCLLKEINFDQYRNDLLEEYGKQT